jgi:hypothetical protein
MAKANLDQKHESYTAVQPTRERASDLYAGPVVVKAKAEQYLYKTANEEKKDYEHRLKRAVYDNWLAVVILGRLAMLWRKAPEREVPEELQAFLDDVDRRGTAADVFFKSMNELSSVEGLRFVLVDKTSVALLDGETGPGALDSQGRWWPHPFTVAAEEALGIRPFFKPIPAESVYDWKFGDDGLLDWVVIASNLVAKGEPGFPAKVTPQRIIWRRNTWEVWEKADPNKDKDAAADDWVLRNMGINPLGEIPLVAFYGIKEEDFVGWPICKDWLDHVVSIYNKFSDRDISEFLTNNPIPYFIGSKKPEALTATHGRGIYLEALQGIDAKLGYMETSGNGAEASRNSERDLIRRIMEMALRQAKKDTAQVQSDDSLKEEARIFTASLASTAVAMESGERKCWEYLARWQAKDPKAKDAFNGSVTYNKDFDDDAIQTEMVKIMSDMVEKSQLPLEIFLELLKKGEVLPEDIDIKAALRKIEDDLNRLSMPGFGQKQANGQGPQQPAANGNGGDPNQGNQGATEQPPNNSGNTTP